MTHRIERKIINTVYDSPQSSTRELALQVEKDLGLRVSHETMGVSVIRIWDKTMSKEVYLDILKNELTANIKISGFFDPVNPNKFNYNDTKHN